MQKHAVSRLLVLALLALGTAACEEDTLLPPGVASVEIAGGERNLMVGDTLTLQAQARTADGWVISGLVPHWRSNDTTVVAISNAGAVVARGAGRATVRVVIDGRSAETEFAVSQAPAASVYVSPEHAAVVEGDTMRLVATARDQAGNELDDRPAVWRSADTAIVEVDATGLVRARARGSALITAEVDGRTAQSEIIVVERPAASIAISPAPVVLDIGRTRQLTARVMDAGGNVLADRPVIWTIDAPAVATLSATGLLAGTGPGYATITARSGAASTSIAVTVTRPEVDDMPYDLIYHQTRPGVVGEIMILGSGEGVRPATLNAGNVSRQPAPSPDGQRIAFYVSQKELGTGRQIDDIFAVDRNGMNMKQLTDDDAIEDQPAWSPDGSRIAYRHMDRATGRTSIRVMKADGSGKVNLTADMEQTHWVGEPAWSPDGQRIAFSASTMNPTSQGIWSMDANGGNRRQHTNTNRFDSQPTWSPDGQRLAFIRLHGDDPDITILAIADGTTSRIALPGQQRSPSWSPDGRHFVYWQPIGPSGDTAIYTVRVDGTNVRVHTDAMFGAYDPQWIRR